MSGCDLFYHVSIYRIVMRYRKIYIDHKANVGKRRYHFLKLKWFQTPTLNVGKLLVPAVLADVFSRSKPPKLK